jgi:hypothetical protein
MPLMHEFSTPTQGKSDNCPSPFVSVKTANPTLICTKPIAADDNPALHPQRMFHAASVKALLPPGEEGANEIDIVMGYLPTKIINQLKNQWPNRLFSAPTC